ncbi:MAG: hypothetical protein JO100_18620 [Pseudonocardia sp.]|nr:hypothetical protein [Pseudonocardia sp.]
MRGAVELAVELLRRAGYEVGQVNLNDIWGTRGAAWQLCARQAWDGYQSWGQLLRDQLQPSTMRALEVGSAVSDETNAKTQHELIRLRHSRRELFDAHGVDVWILPLAPMPPPSVDDMAERTSTLPHPDDDDYELRSGYTPIASFCGLPALTLPVTRDERGAPLCVQFVGPPGGESRLLWWGQALEKAVATSPLPMPARPAKTDEHAVGRPTPDHV